MYLVENLSHLARDVRCLRYATRTTSAEFVHFHDTCRHGRLHLPDHLLDIQRGNGGLIRQAANFAGHHQEPRQPRQPFQLRWRH